MDFIYCYFVVIKFTGSHSGNGLHSFVFRPPLIKYKRELIPIAIYIEVTIEDTHTHNLTLHNRAQPVQECLAMPGFASAQVTIQGKSVNVSRSFFRLGSSSL